MENNNYEKENVFKAVVYTDGSTSHPIYRDVGYIGSSAHGYIYNINNIGTPNKDNPSSTVSTTIRGYATMVNNDVKVTPDVYIDALYVRNALFTNNVAEVSAIMNTIDKLLELDYNLDGIFIKSDSSYAIHIYEELLYGNPLKIEEKKNGDLWVLIREQLLKCQSRNIEVKMIKVKGHSGDFGNEIADMLANQARYVSEYLTEEKKDIKEYFYLTEAKKYWKPNIERNPFLTTKFLYFTQYDRIDKDNSCYAVMDYPTSKELGVGTNEALFGLIFPLKDNDKYISEEYAEIENILDMDREVVGTLSTLSELNLNAFYSRDFIFYKKLFGNEIYKPNKFNSGVSAMNTYLTLRTFQGLAKLTYNKILSLKKIAELDFKQMSTIENDYKNDGDYIIDITDLLYKEEMTKAKVPVAKKVCIVDMKDKTIDKILEIDKQKVKICINLGTEIMTRNNLKRIEKEVEGVYLHISRHNKVLQYCTIIKTTSTLAFYTNLYSRNVLLK